MWVKREQEINPWKTSGILLGFEPLGYLTEKRTTSYVHKQHYLEASAEFPTDSHIVLEVSVHV